MMQEADCTIGEVVEYQSYPEAYADLANGRLDYVINALISVNDLIRPAATPSRRASRSRATASAPGRCPSAAPRSWSSSPAS